MNNIPNSEKWGNVFVVELFCFSNFRNLSDFCCPAAGKPEKLRKQRKVEETPLGLNSTN